METSSSRRALLLSLMLGMSAGAVLAQPLSARPIRLVVPLPAGTATDLGARVLGQHLSATLGQPVIVENKPGANGVIGAMEVIKAAPDGHTLLFSSQSAIATNVALVKNLPYDPLEAFSPIAGFGQTMHALMVRTEFPAKTMQEFIDYAKKHSGRVMAGSTTALTEIQIATMNKMANIEVVPVPYKGVPAAINDLIGGSLDVVLVDLTNAIAHAKAGKIRPIAVTAVKRSSLVPDWPAISETLPGFDFPAWVGLVGPRGIPANVVNRLNAASNNALGQPEVKARLATMGMTPLVITPEQLGSLISSDVAKWVRLAREANIQPE
jgi:tripartite-type tricarboxylate transporter receptor subunit TctC